ncbi:MAG: 2-C-methyl-D-erythritol 2,4-cyclodiphosphate synthase [Mucispirillum sp.]|nr:2-C-methyl-D-erythritol 2,4-cyclodiphosphate synthase [Mucispirillum sp.]
MDIKCGIGFDAHCFDESRRLFLGGVEIAHDKGLAGHSDADVLIHAIIDSLTGPAFGKDIGMLFPDTDDAYKDIDSKILLRGVAEMIYYDDWRISHIDSEIIAQEPKLAPYIPEMQRTLAEIMGIKTTSITIKATTTEKMGFTGRGEGIAALASSILIKGA